MAQVTSPGGRARLARWGSPLIFPANDRQEQKPGSVVEAGGTHRGRDGERGRWREGGGHRAGVKAGSGGRQEGTAGRDRNGRTGKNNGWAEGQRQNGGGTAGRGSKASNGLPTGGEGRRWDTGGHPTPLTAGLTGHTVEGYAPEPPATGRTSARWGLRPHRPPSAPLPENLPSRLLDTARAVKYP